MNSKQFNDKRLKRAIAKNEVSSGKEWWCVGCLKSEQRKEGSMVNGHTISFKCEACDVPL